MRVTSLVCLLTAGMIFLQPTPIGAATLTIPGTGACEATLRGVAADYERSRPLAKVVVPPSVHSEGGIRQVIEGKAVLARVSRPLTPEESGNGLVYRAFARDAVVFAVGAGVTARNLSIGQLADIFSGKIGAWEQVDGGKGPIRVLYRQTGDSNAALLQATLNEFRDLRFTREGKALYYDHEMVEMLQKYRNSVGFLTLSTIVESGSRIRHLTLDVGAPTKENVAAGRYPLVIEYALVYRKGALPPEAGKFIDFLFTREGKRSLSAHGLIPVER